MFMLISRQDYAKFKELWKDTKMVKWTTVHTQSIAILFNCISSAQIQSSPTIKKKGCNKMTEDWPPWRTLKHPIDPSAVKTQQQAMRRDSVNLVASKRITRWHIRKGMHLCEGGYCACCFTFIKNILLRSKILADALSSALKRVYVFEECYS